MKKKRRTPEEARKFYEPVLNLSKEKGLTNAESCRELGIDYNCFKSWEGRVNNPGRQQFYERNRDRRNKETPTQPRKQRKAKVTELPQVATNDSDLIIKMAFKIPSLLSDLNQLEHNPVALKYLAQRRQDYLQDIRNAKLALHILGKAFLEANY